MKYSKNGQVEHIVKYLVRALVSQSMWYASQSMWCTSFELLGIVFNQTLDKMDCNYDKCLKIMHDELNSWQFRHLTIFGKITVTKTLCLPKFTHITAVIPNLCMTKLNKIEKEWETFIKMNGCPTDDKETRYLSKKENGLGMLKLSVFWRSVRRSWLRRQTTTKSTWKMLHLEEVDDDLFNPINSNMDSLEGKIAKMMNPVWKEIYSALMRCQKIYSWCTQRNMLHFQ